MNESHFITTIIIAVISNIPILMTALALAIGEFRVLYCKEKPCGDIFLSQLMFFAVGLSGISGFIFHAFFPVMTAQFIGWENSPFQFEVAMANLGMGCMGIFGYRASRGYQIATTVFTASFLWGAALGHIIQMISRGNFAPGNAGTAFYYDILLPLLLILFLTKGRRCNFVKDSV